ncbi:MAG: YicC/YloC family endoribonuclease [Armatimonadota bacterium]|nr:YicC/YloC family endoribonuclease [Armatimonadota bacterium]MDR7427918.1 YicC/YloC family endoribonuclease [Armatimonadota bacterium]MDR7464187.1 YicC/YloC family endoribonuclease [Armatimonadota bacterium]MDR7470590.1 YicC/YloC family endoribonuclease [Armatimonadota bacterium]MDR7475700.1 YicC/YloC family endoribonuclease [Armatimonadota bacterium]
MRSMTGFGAAVTDTPWGRISVEMRSLNHRFTEIQVRLPRELAALEDRVRGVVQRGIQRGRVEVTVSREAPGGRPRAVRADLALAREYLAATRQVKRALRLRGEVTLPHLLAFPEVVRLEEAREDVTALWPDLERVVAAALQELLRMRAEEGARLAADAVARLDRVQALVEQVAQRAQVAVAEYAGRLRQRLTELLGEVPLDEGRLAAELALLAERSDITEEVTRLRSHLAHYREAMAGEGAVGRKLEFLLQEMGRETNTIGAKANDLEISRSVIAIKGELESLREQVQNVE